MAALCLAAAAAGCAQPPHASAATTLAERAAAGTEAYVCNFAYASQPGSTLATVDVADGRRGSWVGAGSLPSALAATPDGRRLLVANQQSDTVTVVDTADDHTVATITTGLEPDAVAVSPDGRTALVANLDDDTVTPIDLTTMAAQTPIAVGARPDALAIGGPSGTTALVADGQSNTVTIVNLSTRQTGPVVAVGSEPDAIAITALSGDRAEAAGAEVALVANFGDGTVTPIDMSTWRAEGPITVGVGPTDIAVPPGLPSGAPASVPSSARPQRAWVSGGNSLVPIDLDTLTRGPAIDVGHIAEAVAISNDGRSAWVADQNGTVVSVALASGATGRPIFVGGRPSAIVIPPRRAPAHHR